MNQIYLLQNQDKLFLSKQNEWLDGREPGSLYKAHHKDEALNRLVEVNTKDYSQRIHVLSCPVKPSGSPQIDPEHLPPPMEKTKPAVSVEPSEGEAETSQNHQSELAINRS